VLFPISRSQRFGIGRILFLERRQRHGGETPTGRIGGARIRPGLDGIALASLTLFSQPLWTSARC
ncbi:hypothetical protein JTP77_042855, partial [Streptomyces sp. S9]|nr:hypothetical protein [Streptomyces sp. S9]